MAGQPGGSAPLAMMCSGLILWVVESKYTKLPLRMLTAPTLKRISPALMRSKSTSRSGVHAIEDDVTHIAAQPVMGDAEGIEQELGRDLLPKGAQLFEPRLGCVAGDQGGVDR